MSIVNFKSLKIGNFIAKIPIIQGGMGVRISLSGLASAVANEGGIGVIATAGIGILEPDAFSSFLEANIRILKKEIRKARALTKGILGINILGALTNYADMVKTAIAEGIDIIFSGAGLPLNLPQYLKASDKTALVPIVSSNRAARIIAQKWVDNYNYVPDAFVVEGPLAGGHLGFKKEQIKNENFTLEKIVPEVITEIKVMEEKFKKPIPVIAAGGIYTGEDIYKFFRMGASGVQMATRFVATDECDASLAFKKAYLNAREEDIIIIDSPVGLPGRAIKNKFIEDINRGEKKPFKCPYHCIKTCDYLNAPYCIALALVNAQRGYLKNGFVFAGANVHRVAEITSVKKLIEGLTEEYLQASKNDSLESSIPTE
jgi:NAD(P)H-dependent flavin oxidoreductase YrpB (nitropropane dioxygenase family)